MVTTSIILISVAAILGVVMLYYLFGNKNIPKSLAFIHGPLALIGLIFLIIYAITTSEHHKHYESITLFSAAAFGGAVLFYKDITGKKIPKWLGVLHGTLAIVGIVFVVSHLLEGL